MENYQGTIFGKLRIPLYIFHNGDWGIEDVDIQYTDSGLLTYDEERKQFLYDFNKDTRIPEDVRTSIKSLVEKRRGEAKARGAPFFDGQMVRFVDYSIEIKDKDAEAKKEKLILKLVPTSFFAFIGTNRSYDESVLKDKNGLPVSMRNKYGVDVKNLDDWMANPIGVSTTVISETSGALIVAERSEKLEQYPGLYGVAAAGFMDRIRDTIDNKPNPFRTMQRELQEEIGIGYLLTDSKYGFRLLGIGRALDDLHGEFWGETLIPLTVEKILSAPKKAKYESLRMFPVEFSPKEVIPYVAKTVKEVPKGITSGREAWIIGESPAWVPAHAYATILSLVKHYGFENVTEELERNLGV